MSEIKNLSASIDLSKLSRVSVANIPGKTGTLACVIIPVDENDIVRHANGGIYLNLNVLESREVKFGQTHYIKQNFSKDFRESYAAQFADKDERNKINPILGNAKPLEFEQSAAPAVTSEETVENKDDLPF